jgi:DNA-binding response OmpR family regulator
MRPRLLVVEDDAEMQVVWRVVFANRGWDVAIASSVGEGMALLDPAPDFLILDLMLPDRGGEAILRKVRDDKLPTRVAVTTGSEDPAQLSVVRSFDPEALFEKPIDIVDMWREGEAAKAG